MAWQDDTQVIRSTLLSLSLSRNIESPHTGRSWTPRYGAQVSDPWSLSGGHSLATLSMSLGERRALFVEAWGV